MIERKLVCPDCFQDKWIESQTKGYFMLSPLEDHDHNPNLHFCGLCGFEWREPCPVCGVVADV